MLHVGHLNVYHLDAKVQDICNFLHSATPVYHLYGITESRLHDSIPDTRIRIPEYDVIRRDSRRTGENGIAAYIHSSIVQYTRRRPDLEHKDIECMWLEFKLKETAPSTLVCFLYRNPSAIGDWYDDLIEMIDTVYKCKPHADILLLGDFNIDLLKPQPRWDGIVSSLGFKQLITLPTRVTETSSTLLDHIYSNNHSSVLNASLADLSISDHSPIFCTKTTKMPKSNHKGHTVISFRSFKNFDRDSFLSDLNVARFDQVFNHTVPDQALECWYDTLLPIINKHAPIKKMRVKHPKLPPWMSNKITEAMDQRDLLKKAKQFQDYKTARNRLKNMVRDSKKAYFNKLVENNRDISQIWRALNSLIRGSTSNSTQIPRHLTPDIFNSHFSSVATSLSNPDNASPNNSDNLSLYCKQKTANKAPFQIPPIAVHELGRLISQLQNKKSSGPDEISNHLLKLSLPYTVDSLTYIFNLCIQRNTFPQALKKAKVIPLPKSKNTSDVSNYRPISLLSVLSKLLERHIHINLTKYMDRLALFHPLQSGFRSNHSCSTALSLLTDKCLSAINSSQLSGVVYLDFSKAFDLVDHKILLNKLSLYLNGSDSLSFFQSFLENRSQQVYVHGAYSREESVLYGVPQGSVLGPILFCIYVNDLPLHFSDNSVECHMLADDTTLRTQNRRLENIQQSLQHTLRDISQWCSENNMVLNPLKSKSMVITTRQKHQLSPLSLDLTINGNSIEKVSEHKLLGVIIDDKLRWHSHIEHLCKRVSRNLFLLSKLQSVITLDARKMFYNAHIKPHIDYASVIWDGCSDALFKTINSRHRRSAKLILPDPSLTTDAKLTALNIPQLKQQLLFNKSVFMHKILHDQAPEYLTHLFQSTPSRYSTFKHNLACPKPRIDIFKTSLSYSGAYVWNSLPTCLKSTSNLKTFKTHLQKYIQTSL